MDSSKVLPLTLLLLVPGLMCLARRAENDGARRAALLSRAVAVLAAVSALAGAVDFCRIMPFVMIELLADRYG